jgi:hypothetical protein
MLQVNQHLWNSFGAAEVQYCLLWAKMDGLAADAIMPSSGHQRPASPSSVRRWFSLSIGNNKVQAWPPDTVSLFPHSYVNDV